MESIEKIDYNTLYRNFPGWFYDTQDTVKKAKKAEEAKKPVIPDVSGVAKKNSTRLVQDSYDKEGSNIRNDIRKYTYSRYGKEVAI